MSSRPYEQKASRKNGIELVKKNSCDDAMYERKEAKDGSAYFNLESSNGRAIRTSEMYSPVSDMENV
ncbi:DUF1508 domain-containing protein [Ulvibacterium sp.]|uniref:DUF1508 domain-containing protein n=1 Tax=Ulvibacterium sp. TaxID=2665914 RepID=UPI003CC50E2D